MPPYIRGCCARSEAAAQRESGGGGFCGEIEGEIFWIFPGAQRCECRGNAVAGGLWEGEGLGGALAHSGTVVRRLTIEN